MHLEKNEARRGGNLARAPENCSATELYQDEPQGASRQAVWLAHRLGLTIERARLIAELAFPLAGRRA